MIHLNQILIIEDDAFHSRILSKMLSNLTTATIHHAGDGKEGLSLVELHKPDIIFCDLNMPNMDGVEFLNQLSLTRVQPMVVLTSSANEDVQNAVVSMSRAVGFEHVSALHKPMSVEALAMKLEEWQTRGLSKKVLSKPQSNTVLLSPQEVKLALANDHLQPHFQAHFDAKTGAIVGAEALVRWEHPIYGSLTPNHFLPLVIDQDLSAVLALNMIRSSVSHAANWHKNGFHITVSVNVLPSDIAQPKFADRVLAILDEANFSPNYLTLEITEEEITTDLTNTIANTARLRIRGVSISIDDFGTGHSSLSQLIHSPFNELKIDRSFVNKMSSSPKHLAVLKSIIDLSHSIGLNIVAEGVETQEEATFLSELGCQTLQGFYFNKPQAITEFNKLLDHSISNVS